MTPDLVSEPKHYTEDLASKLTLQTLCMLPLLRSACHYKSVMLSLCYIVDRGPLMALVLEKEEAVDSWKELLGPTELDVALIEAPERLVPWVLIQQYPALHTLYPFVMRCWIKIWAVSLVL